LPQWMLRLCIDLIKKSLRTQFAGFAPSTVHTLVAAFD